MDISTTTVGKFDPERMTSNMCGEGSRGKRSHECRRAGAVDSGTVDSQIQGGRDAVVSIMSKSEDCVEELIDHVWRQMCITSWGGHETKTSPSCMCKGMKGSASDTPPLT